jgi:hypothetical protein
LRKERAEWFRLTPGCKLKQFALRLKLKRCRLLQLKEEMQGQNQALSELPVGSVVTQFTVENPVEVRIGENIFQRLEGGEILVKDGVIQEIRV